MARPSHVVIFEPDYRGHQFEYVRHIVQFLEQHDSQMRVTFCVDPHLAEQIEELLGSRDDQFDVRRIDEEAARICREGSLYRIDATRWRCMRDALVESGADHGLFLEVDLVQLSLALRRSVPNGCTLSGILFKPSIHYQEKENSLRERLRDLRKSVLYRLMLGHPALTTVFSLDVYFPEYAASTFKHGHKLHALPDPFPAPDRVCREEEKGEPLPDFWQPERTTFLLFGSLSRRKGIFETLEALRHLSHTEQKKTSVIFAGRLQEEVVEEFRHAFHRLKTESEHLHVHLENRFIPEDDLATYIQMADVILAPYQRSMGSSGVLLWTAGMKTPVITQEYGFIGRYAREHQLGATTDTTQPERIASTIKRFVGAGEHPEVSKEKMEALSNDHTPRRFARTLFQNILGEALRDENVTERN